MSAATTSPEDVAFVTAQLGRAPRGSFEVVVRRRDGSPMVIENAPFLADGTPMPTLFWLTDRRLVEAVSRVESEGGVHRFESMVDADELAACHQRYARRRDARVPPNATVAPSGGVGGTRTGVKCLHAHLANYLATNDDPVGALVAACADVREALQ